MATKIITPFSASEKDMAKINKYSRRKLTQTKYSPFLWSCAATT